LPKIAGEWIYGQVTRFLSEVRTLPLSRPLGFPGNPIPPGYCLMGAAGNIQPEIDFIFLLQLRFIHQASKVLLCERGGNPDEI
jgi:hypothetical protein